MEQAIGVRFPSSLLQIVKLGDALTPDKQTIVRREAGEEKVVDVLANILSFGDEAEGILSSHKTLIDHRKDRLLELWLDDDEDDEDYAAINARVEREADQFHWIIPVGDNADGWVCLDYRQDPSRVDCQVVSYSLTPLEDSDEDGLVYIAHTFDEMLSMLRKSSSLAF